jgi:hypothetical protein
MPDIATKIKTDEYGNVLLTKQLVEELEPNTVYKIERQGKAIRLEPEPTTEPFWKTATKEQRLAALKDLLDNLPPGPGLSDWAVSRDSIYD